MIETGRLIQIVVLTSNLLSTHAVDEYYNQIVLNTSPGSPRCEVPDQTVGKWSDDISCVEGETILNKANCTLQCPENLVPSFATLYCLKGHLSPPGR